MARVAVISAPTRPRTKATNRPDVPGRLGLRDGGGEHLARRPGDRAVEGLADHVADLALSQGGGQADDGDDALDQDERHGVGQRAGVTEPVGKPQSGEAVLQQFPAAGVAQGVAGVVTR